jgi:hypothetical protein
MPPLEFRLTQAHHGISCTDIERTKTVLRVLGFTATQPGAPEPLVYRNQADDYIGQITASTLGDEYHTHYVENPATGQQIDLIEIGEQALSPRDWDDPAQGDLVIGIPSDDPLADYHAMQAADPEVRYSEPVDVADGIRFIWRDGQHTILTTTGRPFAILHYSTADFPKARAFFESVMGVSIQRVGHADDGAERYRMQDIGGHMDIEVRPTTRRLDFSTWGKHYPGANHFRLVGRDLDAIASRIDETGAGGFLIPPMGGFAFVYGPTSETVETFDKSFLRQ